MCIETTYLAMCGHYTHPPVYDFCHVAIDRAISRSKSVRFYLWRWSGRDLDKIDRSSQRTQPCNRVRVKRKKNSPYWRNRLCDVYRDELRKQNRWIKEHYGRAENPERRRRRRER
ncbi:hypothetical protein PMZ80_003235 [Knufia obscura]|uniref:Uncharacterized protein n=2 Tax=Knufia TaxID=430999 RepID=A0AAN8EGM8_9EURO|nr:hypothetical protein PMZ80_003235 [Knufia obscura]KAK5950352.1 hypothetical protein OHC33_008571 [Knufia fluminis]